MILDGQRHMRIKDVGMKLDIGDMKIYATNMINGSPELSKCTGGGGVGGIALSLLLSYAFHEEKAKP